MTRTTLIAAVSLFAATAISSGVAYAAQDTTPAAAPAAAQSSDPINTALSSSTQDEPDPELLQPGIHVNVPAGIHGSGFCYGLKNPEQFIGLLNDALKKDSNGNIQLDPAVCGRGRATPRRYLDAFQITDPKANLTSVSQIPQYISSLVLDCSPPKDAQWYTAMILSDGSVAMDYMWRGFKSTECGLKNPITGKFVLFMHCANPIGEIVTTIEVTPVVVQPVYTPPENCYQIHMKYQGQPDVTVNDDGSAQMIAHIELSEADWNRLYADKCFGIGSTDHPDARLVKPTAEDCDGCRRGGYPSEELAIAGQLPAYKPTYTYSFRCRQESCYNSFPKWVLEKIKILVYCVDVERYTVALPDYFGSSSFERYSVVLGSELDATKTQKELPRVLRGLGHLPSDDVRNWPQ